MCIRDRLYDLLLLSFQQELAKGSSTSYTASRSFPGSEPPSVQARVEAPLSAPEERAREAFQRHHARAQPLGMRQASFPEPPR
eukprot:7508657-Pyramimonas_sp.AAC.1